MYVCFFSYVIQLVKTPCHCGLGQVEADKATVETVQS